MNRPTAIDATTPIVLAQAGTHPLPRRCASRKVDPGFRRSDGRDAPWLWIALLTLLATLSGCASTGDASRPVPTLHVPAPRPATRLVVVLPGRGDDIAGLQRAGIADAIQSAWPDADVTLTGLSLAYYLEGRAAPRLREEIVRPARVRGYREVWLLGASMGGMGAIMYDRHYPDEVDGFVLLAPYLGEASVQREIADAGGLANWNPGPRPAAIDRDNFSRELWRRVQEWSMSPAQASRVWLAYGEDDYLRPGIEMLAPALPASQVVRKPGGHAWRVWTPAAREVLEAIDTRRAQVAR